MVLREYARRQPDDAFLIQPTGAPELTLTNPAPTCSASLLTPRSRRGRGAYAYRRARLADGGGRRRRHALLLGGRRRLHRRVLRARRPDRRARTGSRSARIRRGVAARSRARPTASTSGLRCSPHERLPRTLCRRSTHDRVAASWSRTPSLLTTRAMISRRGGVVVGRQRFRSSRRRPRRAYAAAFAKAFPAIPSRRADQPATVPYRDGVEALLAALDTCGGEDGRAVCWQRLRG